MKKVISIEVDFPDGFVPPEEFDEPKREYDYKSACDLCPFFRWEGKYGCGWCVLLGDEPKTDTCPIKKFFN